MTGIHGSGRGQLLVLLLAAALTSSVKAEDVWHLIAQTEDEELEDFLGNVGRCPNSQYQAPSGACKPCAHASTSHKSNGRTCSCAAGYSHFDAISGECLQGPHAARALSHASSSSSRASSSSAAAAATDSELALLQARVASAQRALLAPSYPPSYPPTNDTTTVKDNVATQELLSNSSSPLVANALIVNASDPRVVGKAEVKVTVQLALKSEDVSELETVVSAADAKKLINRIEAAYKSTLAAQGVTISALNVSSTITVDPPADCATIKANILAKVVATWPASHPVPASAVAIVMDAVQCAALAGGGGRRLLMAIGGARTLNTCGASSPQLSWSIGLDADQAAGVGAAKSAVTSLYSSGSLSTDIGATVCQTTPPTVRVTTVVTVSIPLTQAGLTQGVSVCSAVSDTAAAAVASALGGTAVAGGTSCSAVRTVAEAGPLAPIVEDVPSEPRLTKGEIAAVVICSVLGAALLAGVALVVVRRRNARVAATPAEGSVPPTPSMGTTCRVAPEPAAMHTAAAPTQRSRPPSPSGGSSSRVAPEPPRLPVPPAGDAQV